MAMRKSPRWRHGQPLLGAETARAKTSAPAVCGIIAVRAKVRRKNAQRVPPSPSQPTGPLQPPPKARHAGPARSPAEHSEYMAWLYQSRPGMVAGNLGAKPKRIAA